MTLVDACNAQLYLLSIAAGASVDSSSAAHKLVSDAGYVENGILTKLGRIEVESAGTTFRLKLEMLIAVKMMSDPNASDADTIQSIATIVKLMREAQGSTMKGVMSSDPLNGDGIGDATAAYVRQDSEAIKH